MAQLCRYILNILLYILYMDHMGISNNLEKLVFHETGYLSISLVAHVWWCFRTIRMVFFSHRCLGCRSEDGMIFTLDLSDILRIESTRKWSYGEIEQHLSESFFSESYESWCHRPRKRWNTERLNQRNQSITGFFQWSQDQQNLTVGIPFPSIGLWGSLKKCCFPTEESKWEVGLCGFLMINRCICRNL